MLQRLQLAVVLLFACLQLSFSQTVNVLLTSSLTRLSEDELSRTPDSSFGVGVLVTYVLMDHMNNGDLPITREEEDRYKCDVNFSVTIVDDVSDFSTGLFQITSDPIDLDATHVIIGPGRSSVCVPTSFVTSTSRLPLMSPSCTSPELDDSDAHRFFSRTIPSDDAAAIAIIDLLAVLPTGLREPLDQPNAIDATKQYTQVTVLYQEDSYGSAYKDALFENAGDITFTIIPFSPGDEASLSTAVDLAAATEVNVFIGIIFVEHLETLVNLTASKGMMGEDNVWIFADGVLGGSDIVSELEATDGARVASLLGGQLDILSNNFFIQATGKTDENTNFYEAFREEFTSVDGGYIEEELREIFANIQDPASSDISVFPEQNFSDFITTVFAADSDDEKDLLISDFALFGYDSVIAIRELIDQTNCTQDEIDLLFDGEEFMNNLTQLTFQGVTGNVEFDAETGSRTQNSSAMKLVNLRFSETADNEYEALDVIVGIYEGRTWTIDDELILFPDAEGMLGGIINAPLLTDPPEEVERNEVTETTTAIVFGFAGMILVSVALLIVFIFINTQRNVIAAAQPVFLILTLIGVVISTCSVFVLTQDPLTSPDEDRPGSTMRCNAPFIMISLGLTISYAALVFKLQRLVMIAQLVPNLRYKRVSIFDTLKYLVLVVIMNIVVIAFCLIIDPLMLQQRVLLVDSFDQPEETYDVCAPDSGTGGKIYAMYFLFHIAFYAYGIALILKVRNLSTDFQEGKWITLSILSQLQINLLGIPVVVAIGAESTDVRFLVISLLVILSNVVLLLLIFAPKIYKIYTGDDVQWEPHTFKSNQSKPTNGLTEEEDMSRKIDSVRRSLENTMATQEFGIEEHSL